MALTDRPMDVLGEAQNLGFAVSKEVRNGETVWAWHRGTDTEWPAFPTKGAALAWIEERIRTGTLFDR